jgi:two-component system sensor histidine kinase RstB
MSRLFLRISIGILITLIISSLFAALVIRTFTGRPEDQRGHGEFWGSIRLMQERLDEIPAEHAASELDSLRASFNFPLIIVPRDDSLIPPDERARLEGRRAPRPQRINDRRMLYIPLVGERVLIAGPLPEPPKPSHWFLALVFGGVVVLVGTAGFILVSPVVKHLRELENSAVRFGEGELSARANIDSRDAVGSLALRFNAMADGVQRRIEGQRQLLQAVSHELRTPTARIRFGLDMLSDAKTEDERKRHLASIDDALTDLDQLIGELLDFNRFGADSPGFTQEAVALREALEDVIGGLTEFANGISIRIDDEVTNDVTVHAHRASFHRAVQNLLTNALRYAKSQVYLRYYRVEHGVAIEVGDDGPGVPEGDRERVFDPFTRVDSSRSRESGGAGLGLAIVRRIVRLHHGSIKVAQSSLGGALFVTTWPDQEHGSTIGH